MNPVVTFGEALEALKEGSAIKRLGWREETKVVYLSEEGNFFEMSSMNGVCPWSPTHADLLEEDWMVIVSDEPEAA